MVELPSSSPQLRHRTAVVVTAGAVIARALRACGVDTVYGAGGAGLAVMETDHACATALAAAQRRVLGSRAAVHRGGGDLAAPGYQDAVALRCAAASDLVEAVVQSFGPGGGGRLVFDGDLGQETPEPLRIPVPVAADRWSEPDDAVVRAVASARAPVILAGPGVLIEGEVAGLHGLAASGSVGVLNTWGAKGIFHWRSRHHLATGGLQALDFELGGLADADLIVACGLDEDESPSSRWRLADAIEVAPAALAPLAGRWGRPWQEIEVPALRAGLAAVTQAGWASTAGPLPPSLATRNYGTLLGRTGLLAADPGVAGFWAARTFSTTEPGAVMVPAAADAAGLAVAAAFVARSARPGRPVLAVLDALDATSLSLLELAASRAVAVPVEIWDPNGPLLDGDAHLERLAGLLGADRPQPARLQVAAGQLAQMVGVAGPVTAWGGIPGGDGSEERA